MSGSLCLPFPLRKDFLAQIVIPRDMTKAEADRLCAFVNSLAYSMRMPIDDEPIVRSPSKEGDALGGGTP